jgi:hypothetical protein
MIRRKLHRVSVRVRSEVGQVEAPSAVRSDEFLTGGTCQEPRNVQALEHRPDAGVAPGMVRTSTVSVGEWSDRYTASARLELSAPTNVTKFVAYFANEQ